MRNRRQRANPDLDSAWWLASVLEVLARLCDWFAMRRALWVTVGVAGVLADLVLITPGNPVLDLNLRQWRVPGSILSHAAVLFLALAFCGERGRWLDAVARWPLAGWVTYFVVAITAPLGILWLIARVWPAYARALLRESGLVEPLAFVLFLIATGIAGEYARGRRVRGLEYRPYVLAMVICGIFAMEDVDWFGIIGPLVGRPGGVRVGGFHDLLNLAERWPAVWLGLGAAGVIALLGLWRGRYVTPAFVRAEALDPTSVPVYLAVVALGVAQLVDVTGDARVGGIFPYRIEEPLELVGALLLNGGLLLKYARDRRAEAISAAPGAANGDHPSIGAEDAG